MSIILLLTMFVAFIAVDRFRNSASRPSEAAAAHPMIADHAAENVAEIGAPEHHRIHLVRSGIDRRQKSDRRAERRQSAA